MTLGDLNTTQRSPGHTYPSKILCAAFQMQYHKLSVPQRNGTTQQIILWNDVDEKYISLFKAVSQLNVYHFFSSKNADIDDNDKNNDNNGL